MARAASRLSAGKRDHVVRLEQFAAADVADPTSGEPVETWTTLEKHMPVARIGVSGWERFKENQVTARFDDAWEMNYRADMDPDLVDLPKRRKMVYEGRELDIVYGQVIGRRAGIVVLTLASTSRA
jgi:hypothetical protein